MQVEYIPWSSIYLWIGYPGHCPGIRHSFVRLPTGFITCALPPIPSEYAFSIFLRFQRPVSSNCVISMPLTDAPSNSARRSARLSRGTCFPPSIPGYTVLRDSHRYAQRDFLVVWSAWLGSSLQHREPYCRYLFTALPRNQFTASASRASEPWPFHDLI